MDAEFYDTQLKVIILGDQAVGKTCILVKYTDKVFSASHIATIGIDFKTKTLCVENKVIRLQIWDTAGQERFRKLTQNYYKGAMGIILVFDCTKRSSFLNIKEWVESIKEHANSNSTILLVANKTDMDSLREVSSEESRQLAEEMGVMHIETSAKNGQNIQEAFQLLASEILSQGHVPVVPIGVKLRTKSLAKRLCCSQ